MLLVEAVLTLRASLATLLDCILTADNSTYIVPISYLYIRLCTRILVIFNTCGCLPCILTATRSSSLTTAQNQLAGCCRSKQGKASKAPAPSRSEQEASKRREQMAAAAEARMARLKLASQQQQLWS